MKKTKDAIKILDRITGDDKSLRLAIDTQVENYKLRELLYEAVEFIDGLLDLIQQATPARIAQWKKQVKRISKDD